jgi:hypothetical protein
MQTHKKEKRFRKKRTIKKQKYNQKQNQNKKSRILKGVVCYKIRIIPRSNGGGLLDEPKFKRLEDMINKIKDNNNDADNEDDDHLRLFEFLQEIMDGTTDKNKAKKQKVFNEIFNEDVFEPSELPRDTKEEKREKAITRKHSKKVKSLLYYLNNGNKENKPTSDDERALEYILYRKAHADVILTNILDALEYEAVKKQLTAGQIAAIKKKIEGTGGITGALSSVTSKISNGAVSLGNWLAPESLDDSGTPKNLRNRQKIKFLWYPRKHIDYRKGSSTPKRVEDDIEYGDFMILIEPEEYANTGEFFRQTYHSVEDLLATLLMGCDGPFCVRGEVKREPYNWREYVIDNDQPTVDRERRNPQLQEK